MGVTLNDIRVGGTEAGREDHVRRTAILNCESARLLDGAENIRHRLPRRAPDFEIEFTAGTMATRSAARMLMTISISRRVKAPPLVLTTNEILFTADTTSSDPFSLASPLVPCLPSFPQLTRTRRQVAPHVPAPPFLSIGDIIIRNEILGPAVVIFYRH